jgi:hypothetical protein
MPMLRWIVCIGLVITGSATFLVVEESSRYLGLGVVAVGIYSELTAFELRSRK